MGSPELLIGPTFGFWLTIYAISVSVVAVWLIGYLIRLGRRRKSVTWDLHTEFIDISEFSNKNIPLRVTYKGTEPRWLWATYLSLRNSGSEDIVSGDNPDKQHFIVGKEGCRYIGFNRLISDKARVVLSPLFLGNSVFCKIEFDRLGPGDEILASLLFVADEQQRVEVQGDLFGTGARVLSGYRQRMLAWRSLWWLLIVLVVAGTVGGILLLLQAINTGSIVWFQFQSLLIMYLLGLIAAAVFLRPIRFWQQISERINAGDEVPSQRHSFGRTLRFIFGLIDEP